MTRKLNEADRAAVDMLFDRINATGNGNGNGGRHAGSGYVTMTVAVAEERLSAVQRILSTLEAMPAPEPSPDLAVRTLQRVARDAAGAMPGAPMQTPAPAPFIDPTQPMA
jgi:hypothetical protein